MLNCRRLTLRERPLASARRRAKSARVFPSAGGCLVGSAGLIRRSGILLVGVMDNANVGSTGLIRRGGILLVGVMDNANIGSTGLIRRSGILPRLNTDVNSIAARKPLLRWTCSESAATGGEIARFTASSQGARWRK